jgi:predicted metal-dependent hydrolase
MQSADKSFRRGVEQFNAREFFEAHETWEEIWLRAPEPEKTFLQGIIQVAAAFHHYRRGNAAGAQSLLNAGRKKLEQFPALYRRLNLESLRAAAREWAEALASGEDPGTHLLPRLECADAAGAKAQRHTARLSRRRSRKKRNL